MLLVRPLPQWQRQRQTARRFLIKKRGGRGGPRKARYRGLVARRILAGRSFLLLLLLKRRHSSLHLPREMRHEAELALDHHELSAVMHFVLFGREQHFKPCLAGGFDSRGKMDPFRQGFIREAIEERGELLAART